MKWLQRFVTMREIILLAVLIAILFVVTAGGIAPHKPFASVEMRFAELSKTGMQIIPASCPSDPHYAGECSGGYAQSSYVGAPPPPGPTPDGTCTAQYYCNGSNLVYRDNLCRDTVAQVCAWGCSNGQCNAQCSLRYYCSGDDLYYGDVTYSYCSNSKVQTCAYGCSTGACLPPPPPTATISAKPSLVHAQNSTQITWSSTHATACSVVSDGGDSWTGTSGTQTSKLISHQTTFTLTCSGEDGSTVTGQAIVNLIPTWQEQ